MTLGAALDAEAALVIRLVSQLCWATIDSLKRFARASAYDGTQGAGSRTTGRRNWTSGCDGWPGRNLDVENKVVGASGYGRSLTPLAADCEQRDWSESNYIRKRTWMFLLAICLQSSFPAIADNASENALRRKWSSVQGISAEVDTKQKWEDPARQFLPMTLFDRLLKVVEKGLDTPEYFEKEFGVEMAYIPEVINGESIKHFKANAGADWYFSATITILPVSRDRSGDHQHTFLSIRDLDQKKGFCMRSGDVAAHLLNRGWEEREDMVAIMRGINRVYYTGPGVLNSTKVTFDHGCIPTIHFSKDIRF